MAIKVYGSNTCPGTLRFLSILTSHGVMPTFMNVTGSINIFKEFTLIRDTNPIFDKVRGTGSIGFPMIELEDGTYTLDADAVLESLGIDEKMGV